MFGSIAYAGPAWALNKTHKTHRRRQQWAMSPPPFCRWRNAKTSGRMGSGIRESSGFDGETTSRFEGQKNYSWRHIALSGWTGGTRDPPVCARLQVTNRKRQLTLLHIYRSSYPAILIDLYSIRPVLKYLARREISHSAVWHFDWLAAIMRCRDD